MKTFYTYAYLREDGTPYYIGKGSGSRAYKNNRKIPRPSKDRILLLKKNLTEKEAFRHEVYMIAVFGRKNAGTGILRNLTDGGEGISGFTHSEETKKKMSKSAQGLPVMPETRKKISESVKGFKWYNNGMRTIQSFDHPGEGWENGRLLDKCESLRNTGMKWYHRNGVRKMFKDPPGEGWKLGILRPKGKRYYNNGVEHVLAYEPPDNSWTLGRLRKS
jgi:hypothetical protein